MPVWRLVQSTWSVLARHTGDPCGLRDYNLPPLVWGGEAGCTHTWQETVVPPQHSDDGATGSTLVGSTTAQAQTQRTPTRHATCQHCGAWRGSLGLEPAPDCVGWATRQPCGQCYTCHLVEVMHGVWRVLRNDGTAWIVLGDSYAAGKMGRSDHGTANQTSRLVGNSRGAQHIGYAIPRPAPAGLKPKDLVGIPWRCALALQADGWYLRSAITLCKVNPMPESVLDRPTSATEMMFLLTKRSTYFYDNGAIREAHSRDWTGTNGPNNSKILPLIGGQEPHHGLLGATPNPAGRNKRNWWPVTSEPYAEAHFAVFGTKWIEPTILAGTSARGCCPACQAGWVRVVEREIDNTGYQHGPGGKKARDQRGNNASEKSTLATVARYTSTTFGWQPGCDCSLNPAPPIPCTVLDPFAGSGTTGMVALQHGRAFVGIELSQDYLALAQKRLANVQLGFGSLL